MIRAFLWGNDCTIIIPCKILDAFDNLEIKINSKKTAPYRDHKLHLVFILAMKYLFKENEIVGSLLLKKLHDTCTCILIYYSFISYNQYKSFIYTFQPLRHKRTLGMQNTVLSPQACQDYVLFSCKNITTILSLSSELKLCRSSILSFVQCYLLITVTFKIMWNEKLTNSWLV